MTQWTDRNKSECAAQNTIIITLIRWFGKWHKIHNRTDLGQSVMQLRPISLWEENIYEIQNIDFTSTLICCGNVRHDRFETKKEQILQVWDLTQESIKMPSRCRYNFKDHEGYVSALKISNRRLESSNYFVQISTPIWCLHSVRWLTMDAISGGFTFN